MLEVSDDLIVVQKDDEKWEIGRDKSTKVEGQLEGRGEGDDLLHDERGVGRREDEKATPAPI